MIPLLNGLEHLDTIRRALPDAVVVAGSIGRVEAVSPEPGVVVRPGAMQFTRMFFVPISFASARVSEMTAPFDAT